MDFERFDKLVKNEVYMNVDSFVRFCLDSGNEDAPINYDDYNQALEEYYQNCYNMPKKELKKILITDDFGFSKEDLKGYSKLELLRLFAEYDSFEIFEYWCVSDWLGERLKEHGEFVMFAEYTIWGRQCSGQKIAMDGVIQRILQGLYKNDLA